MGAFRLTRVSYLGCKQKLKHVEELHAKTMEQMKRQHATEVDSLKQLHESQVMNVATRDPLKVRRAIYCGVVTLGVQLKAYQQRETDAQYLKNLADRVEVSHRPPLQYRDLRTFLEKFHFTSAAAWVRPLTGFVTYSLFVQHTVFVPADWPHAPLYVTSCNATRW